MTVRPVREPTFVVLTSLAESPRPSAVVLRDIEAMSRGRLGVHP